MQNFRVYKNRKNQLVTKWESYKHPKNTSTDKLVFWDIIEEESGKTYIRYSYYRMERYMSLDNITKEEAIKQYS